MKNSGGKDLKDKIEGKILKGYGGFYYVSVGNKLWECRLRGRLRKTKVGVLIGDQVLFEVVDEGLQKGVIDTVLPRKNELIRPPVSNVDQALVVLALEDPLPDLWLLDRLLVMIAHEGIEPLLCWNKADLARPGIPESFMEIYTKGGLRQVQTCALTGEGIETLKDHLRERTTVLAGPSGVGKSSLLNHVEPHLTLKTGVISEKLGRGKHTTRHVEWIPLSFGGWVADTPGFSQIYLPQPMSLQELQRCYPEFLRLERPCRYPGCSHVKEQDCEVKEAVTRGEMDAGRYERYVSFTQELATRRNDYEVSSGSGRRNQG